MWVNEFKTCMWKYHIKLKNGKSAQSQDKLAEKNYYGKQYEFLNVIMTLALYK